MREFTLEEKELIINTEITADCFDIDADIMDCFAVKVFLEFLEKSRKELADNRKHSCFDLAFDNLVRLLLNSYKTVKLSEEKKDICKRKYYISEKPSLIVSNSIPCYERMDCRNCKFFQN